MIAVLFGALVFALPGQASATDSAMREKIARLSVPFVANAGQWDSRVAFAAQTFVGTLFVTRDGQLVYSLPGKPRAGQVRAPAGAPAADGGPSFEARPTGWVLTETLVDADDNPRALSQSALATPAGFRPMNAKVSYRIGRDRSRHADLLDTYEGVNLGDMYPGVNVQLRATGNNVEKIFTVAPKHDAGQIRIKLAGAKRIEIGAQGELIAHTGNGPVTFTAPIAFQEAADGQRMAVPVSYALIGSDGTMHGTSDTLHGEASYAFNVGAYDNSRPLVIDPLLQSSYLGGSGEDRAHALAIHPVTGDVYMTGITNSANLPSVTTASGGVAAGAQSTISSFGDAFVARFNASLTAISQTSYFGGTGGDIAYAIAVHPLTGDVYVAGHTDSADLPSLTVAGGGVATGAQSVKSIGNDVFVARFNAALTALPQVSYLGGSGEDYARAIAIHPATGEVYVAGYTGSFDLPGVTVAAGGAATGAQSVKAAGSDSFVARFNPALTAMPQATYFGGNGAFDYAYGLAIHHASGEVYIAGYTDSTDLPSVSFASGGVATAAQSTKSGGLDAFVARFNAALTQRPQASYFGGSGTDIAYAVAIHPDSGEIYLAGATDSGNLPGVSAASGGIATGAQSVKAASEDAFVVRFNAALTARPQATYFGGVGVDRAYAIVIHPGSGEVYIAGNTSSVDLPSTTPAHGGLADGAQAANSVLGDTFIARLNAALTTRPQASYFGGNNVEQGTALAIHPATGEAYLAGYTQSTDLPARTVDSGGVATGAQSVKAASIDNFIARLSYDLASAALACSLDIDASGGSPDAASDGAMLLRAMLGMTDAAITSGLVAGTPPRDTWPQMRHFLNNSCGTNFAPVIRPPFTAPPCDLDLDGSGGSPNAMTDGLMLLRALLGLTGSSVTSGAIIGAPPRNTWPLIRQYLNDRCGTAFLP
jgi:hypothetical protein